MATLLLLAIYLAFIGLGLPDTLLGPLGQLCGES